MIAIVRNQSILIKKYSIQNQLLLSILMTNRRRANLTIRVKLTDCCFICEHRLSSNIILNNKLTRCCFVNQAKKNDEFSQRIEFFIICKNEKFRRWGGINSICSKKICNNLKLLSFKNCLTWKSNIYKNLHRIAIFFSRFFVYFRN